MLAPPIVIAGAGLAGVTLGRCLLSKGIRSVIIEKASPSPRRHDYSIDLYSWAYRPLLGVLGLEEAAFKERLLVSSRGSSADESSNRAFFEGDNGSQDHFRCHRGRLEMLLREGLDIKWSATVTKAEPGRRFVIAEVDDEKVIETALLVAADGVHSAVRKSLVPDIEPDVLTHVVFYGTRSIPREQYATSIAPQMQNGVKVESRRDNVLLRIFINNSTSTHIDIGYTYSRPSHQESTSDHLYKPNRPTTGAKDIPDAFYMELSALKDFGPAYTEVFDPARVRQDRVLHWLMRIVLLSRSRVQSLAEKNVLMIGDAVHAMPILGSEGGNLAIKDGIELAEWIEMNGTKNLAGFVDRRYQEWRDGVERGVRRLQDTHEEEKPSL